MPKKKIHSSIKINISDYNMTPEEIFNKYDVSPERLEQAYNEKELAWREVVRKELINKKVTLVKHIFFRESDVARLFPVLPDPMLASDMKEKMIKDLKLEEYINKEGE